MGTKNGSYSPGGTDRSIARWIALLLLLVATAACSFPRPPDVGDDIAPAPPVGCSRDPDCSSPRPFCVAAVCAACRDSTSCPDARPVCDMVSHDCRTCAQDSECDSGACDLAAGKCVDQGAILYTSPTGGAADPCIRTSPCSLRHAAAIVDVGHPYIVMRPGRYPGGAVFDGKKVTVVGSNATLDMIDDPLSFVTAANGSAINIRNLNIDEHLTNPDPDANAAILCDMCDLIIDNMQSTTVRLFAAYQSTLGSTLTVRHSSFSGPAVASFQLTLDSCIFRNFTLEPFGSIQITNSIIINDSTHAAMSLRSSEPTNSRSNIAHNTFVGGAMIDCKMTTQSLRVFDSNIFYQIPQISAPFGCEYNYNLSVLGASLAGIDNTGGDPMFKDAANDDFHLKPGSTAIDTANPGDVLTGHDFEGTSRPQGPRSDIGALEHIPSQ